MQFVSRKILILPILIILGIFSCTHVHAAEIFFGSTGREIGVGQFVEIGVFLNTQNESINAFEGEVEYPLDMLEVIQVRDANSIISLWVQKPDVGTPGKIVFAGIIPGGYQGDRGMIFSFIAQVQKPGEIRVTTARESVLRSDGSGTPASITRAPLLLLGDTGTSTTPYYPPYDPDQPESFLPTIGQNPTLFDGQYFIAFATQDKGSGISHYEIAEERRYIWQKLFSRTPGFTIAESPYLLTDQKLRSTIYIKAVDNEGNERIVEVPPTHILWYEKYLIWCILGVVLLLAVTILIRLYGGKKKNQ